MALEDTKDWQKCDRVELVRAIDRECDGWQRDVGLVLTVLERMKCGIGICVSCNVGPKHVCVGGVFSLAELKEVPDEL